MTLTAITASLLFLLQIPKGSIEGTVVSTTTNQPVAGAQVKANRAQLTPDLAAAMSAGLIAGFASHQAPPPANQTGTTDSNGRFVLRDVDPGTYVLTATADGYARQQAGSSRYGKTDIMMPVTVNADGSATNVIFHLMPAGDVSGRVTGTNGEPLAGMEVKLLHPVYAIGGRRIVSQMGSAQTNDRGEFRLFSITPGMYYMSVNAQNNKYPRTFYPGASRMDDVAEFEISPGSDLNGMDFHLSPPPSYTIRGRVVDASTGQFPPNASMTIVPREQSTGGMTSSNASYNRNDGTFEFRDVLAGPYWLRAQLPPREAKPGERPPAPPSAIATVDVNGDLDNVVLTIMTPVSVQGRMRIEGPATNDGPWSVSLKPAASEATIYPTVVPAKVQSDGTFRIDNIVPGEYQVFVPGIGLMGGGSQSQSIFIKDARIGSTDLLTETLKITGAVAGEVQMVLSRNAGEIHGSVRDDQQKPAGVVQIALVPDDRNRTDLYQMVMTGVDGKFMIKGVPPASYKIFALSPPDVTSFFDPAVMKKFEGAASSLTVGESATQTVDLKVLRAP